MIIYNTTTLLNRNICAQAERAFHGDLISSEEWNNIQEKHPVDFYSPNFFIRLGIFILTLIIALFSFGLFSLLILDSIESAAGGLAIFFAVVAYAMLEFMVRTKRHFQSGADDALLWIAAVCLFGGLSYSMNANDTANCVLLFLISLYSTLRFADRVMSVISYLSLLGIFFYALAEMGPSATTVLPFLMMALSGLVYFLAKKLRKEGLEPLYRDCLQAISIAALLGFYLSGNYYLVKEASGFLMNLPQHAPVPFGWFFWIFTVFVPLAYIARGIQKKNIVLIRIGLLLTAAIVFTVRYYYAIAPIEIMMTVTGILLVGVAYTLNRFLKVPRYGFTSLETDTADANEKRALEALLLVQTFSGKQVPGNETEFGGGSFGGGGGSSDF